ncbi:MAG TPA: tail fiber domain-containing protein, partial [Candidatus Binatia bacterium]|nr:tail fiber domain-containing protein [Candidatus Binatia bacterium]
TTDNQPLELKVGGVRSFRLEPNSDGAPNVIGGAPINFVAPGAVGSTIAGGGSLFYSGIGPASNSVAGSYSTVGGGIRNSISNDAWYATVGGGIGNTVDRVGTTIAGGWMNSVYSGYSAIAGGANNRVDTNAGYATIGGGSANWIQTGAQFSTIAGGLVNFIHTNASSSSIGGGYANMILPEAQFTMIGGGQWNSNSSANSVISGGYRNTIESSAGFSFIGGGTRNTIQETSDQSAIVGGNSDSIETGARESFIGGGFANRIRTGAVASFIGSGSRNTNGGYVSLIVGGEGNVIQQNTSPSLGNWSVIGGGLRNLIAPDSPASVIVGGADNTIDAGSQSSFIAGGERNAIGTNVDISAISGGADNSIESQSHVATIAGGQNNVIEGSAVASTIGGGFNNRILTNGAYATIPGGRGNTATNYAFAAGRRAKAIHTGAFVWADSQNLDFTSTSNNQFAVRASGGVRFDTGGAGVILDGQPVLSGLVSASNLAADSVTGTAIVDGSISSADVNEASFSTTFWKTDGNGGTTPGAHFLGTTDNQALELKVNSVRALRIEPAPVPNIIAGISNSVTAGRLGAVIAGGANQTISTDYAVIGGGQSNAVNDVHGTIGGGRFNFAGGGPAATVSGGHSNIAGGQFTTVGGGRYNAAIGFVSGVSGGQGNVVETNADHSVVGGGLNNLIERFTFRGVIAGGGGNRIGTNSDYSIISGGQDNHITNNSIFVTIAGGTLHDVDTLSSYSAIGGGYENNIGSNSIYSTISGGISNVIQPNAPYGTILGGRANAATNQALAAGTRAKAIHTGALVWGDSQNVDIGSTNANSVTMRAAGGYRLFSSIAPTAGVFLAPGGGSWTSISDRNAKENLEPVDTEALLDKVAALPLGTWNYKSQASSVRHIGPMAQDFKSAFGVGETDTGITGVDADGVALAAIQGLNQKVERAEHKLQQELHAREARIVALENELATLKELVVQLLKSGK